MVRIRGHLVLLAIPAIIWGQNPFSLSEKDEIELGRHAARYSPDRRSCDYEVHRRRGPISGAEIEPQRDRLHLQGGEQP
jgi:hypothetical protein